MQPEFLNGWKCTRSHRNLNSRPLACFCRYLWSNFFKLKHENIKITNQRYNIDCINIAVMGLWYRDRVHYANSCLNSIRFFNNYIYIVIVRIYFCSFAWILLWFSQQKNLNPASWWPYICYQQYSCLATFLY